MLPEIELKIKEAANAYTTIQSTFIDREDCSYCMHDFKEGIKHAISHPELLKDEFDKFENWLYQNDWQLLLNGWHDKNGKYHNFNGVFSKYLEYLNSNK